MFLKSFFVAAGICVLPLAALSQSFCIPPSKPMCLSAALTFSDDHFFRKCQDEMEAYRQDVVEHGDCLGRWVEDVAAQARRQQDMAVSGYESAVKYWNCKASNPVGFCPIF